MTSWDYPPRQVTLLLCDGSGTVFGTLPVYEVPMPWWPEAEPVVTGAREHFGVDVTVLRLIASTPVERAAGGPVTYLAEVAERPEVDLQPWPADAPDPLPDEPLRLPYAMPGGPAHDLAWADERLTAAGQPRSGAAVQVKSWNLSSVWRLPTADGP